MANVSDSLEWGDHKATLEAVTGPFIVTEDVAQLFFEAAKESADDYMQNDFLDADGDDLEIPKTVVVGVYALTGHLLETATEKLDDKASVSNYAISVTYRAPTDAEMSIKKRHFFSHIDFSGRLP